MKRSPFPLQWPDGWPRTPSHKRGRSRFITALGGARDEVLYQLRLFGAGHVVISSDLPVRSDGLPYADGRADDPGIAVYWVKRGVEQVIACDHWKTAAENLCAIGKTLEALRGLDRWGSTAIVERAFAGFAALPPGAPAPRKRGWREVLAADVPSMQDPWPTSVSMEDLLAVARARHRRLMRGAHPDAGGSHELAVELNTALAEAERELGATT